MEKTKKVISNLKPHIFLIIIGLFISYQFMKTSIVSTHDGFVHYLRIMGSYQAIEKTGSIPLLIEKLCSGWGYAPNLFYNPISTYIPCFIAIFTNSYITAIKLFFCFNIFLAGEFMYLFVKNITNKKSVGVLAGVLYITNPYYLNNFFIRGAIGEVAALTFLPILFLGLHGLVKGDSKKQFFVVIGAVGLALSHNITLFYGAIFSVLYLALNFKQIMKNTKTIIKYCIIDVIFIVTITSFYTVPLLINRSNTEYAIFNKKMMWTNNTFSSNNAIDLKDLFVNNIEENKVVFKVGVPIISGFVLLLILERKTNPSLRKILTIFLAFGVFSIFMATKYFPWKHVPEIFCILQFPWRMLGFADFFLSFISAYRNSNVVGAEI